MSPIKHNFNPSVTLQAGKIYNTVNGKTVEIFEIKDNGASLNCHGYLHRITPSGRTKKVWNIWGQDGRSKFVWGWSGLDIIKEL